MTDEHMSSQEGTSKASVADTPTQAAQGTRVSILTPGTGVGWDAEGLVQSMRKEVNEESKPEETKTLGMLISNTVVSKELTNDAGVSLTLKSENGEFSLNLGDMVFSIKGTDVNELQNYISEVSSVLK